MNFMTLVALFDVAGNIEKRLSGPAHLRFIIQPVIAVILGVRDGIMDAKAGSPPYLYRIIFEPEYRRESFKDGFKSISKPFVIGIIMDVVVQFYVLELVIKIRR